MGDIDSVNANSKIYIPERLIKMGPSDNYLQAVWQQAENERL